VSEQSFALSPQQIDNLNHWVEFLQTEESKEWDTAEREASKEFNRILSEAKFFEGNDLDAGQLDTLFSHMRRMVNNRALTKLLYTDNGIQNFNSKLRELLSGTEPLPTRIDEFYELSGVGKATMSQFLYAFKPETYPMITRQTFDALGIDPTQLDLAYHMALKQHNITKAEDHSILTLEYLRDWVVFYEVKRLLNLELYTYINHILWNAYKTQGEGEIEPPTKIPLSIERDLKRFLVQNLGSLEAGLKLYKEGDTTGEEYPTETGRIDILGVDRSNNLVVVELKAGLADTSSLGQIIAYMACMDSKAKGRKVRGILVANDFEDKVKFATTRVPDLQLKKYQVAFNFEQVK